MEGLKLIISWSCILLGGVYLFLFLFWFRGWRKIPRLTKLSNYIPSTTITILIAARNEEKLLPATLNAIFNQQYPPELWEVIVIDDHSTDKTLDVIGPFEARGLRVIRLTSYDKFNSYKKLAISKGVEAAKGQLIVCSDADCEMGVNWLSSIAQAYEKWGWKMISGPVTYFKERNIFEHAQSLEFCLLNALGASNFGLGKVGSCNGANLAYEKQAFLAVDGFQGVNQLASGDDELLLHKMSVHFPKQIGYLKSEEAIVYTYAKPTWSDFIQQRIRWASKSTFYKAAWMKWTTILLWLFNLSLLLNLTVALFVGDRLIWVLFLLGLGLKITIETFFILSPLSFFKRTKLLLLVPMLSFVHIFYLVYIGLAGKRSTYVWKGRTVK